MGIAADLAIALDAVQLSRQAGIEPDPWQAALLRSRAPRILLCCSRQAGKSTTVAALALHSALYQPRSLVLILSPSQRQSGELFKKLAAMYGDVGKPVLAESETALTLTLENGSRVCALPGKDGTVRGFSGARLVIIDEAARVPDTLYLAIRPMLAVSQGRLVLLSTPFGTRGFFYETWMQGGDAWERYEVPATACPRITPTFLAEERRAMGEHWYRQEYLCEWVAAIDSVFNAEAIDRAFTTAVTPLFDTPAPEREAGSPTVPGAFHEIRPYFTEAM
jgi:hypothetical protein